jgi:hypothetical protein
VGFQVAGGGCRGDVKPGTLPEDSPIRTIGPRCIKGIAGPVIFVLRRVLASASFMLRSGMRVAFARPSRRYGRMVWRRSDGQPLLFTSSCAVTQDR